ncbi:hypothetical protein Tsubulata_047301 [Turnera subulata]|uniref:Uncharacterized protein n=1 Tax=Turnera subulata TaxID=218843 RepID=A0A9Q0GA81_9ROSI|nr:hypothetical protein Tsubulata_047301 [Turnera subulata]
MSFFMKGEPLVTKLASFAKNVVLPGTMIAALLISPPDYVYSSSSSSKTPKSPN